MNRGILTLILGGVRSGKSRFAEELAEALDPLPSQSSVLFVATAQAFDSEMQSRIERHQEARPKRWRVLEQSRRVGATILEAAPLPSVILLDCLPLLITNVMCDPTFQHLWDGPLDRKGLESIQAATEVELSGIMEVVRSVPAHLIVVSGEVGLGLVPENAMGRMFRDLLGWANQSLSERAKETYFLASGNAIPLKQYSVSVASVADVLRQSFPSPSIPTEMNVL